MLILASQVAIWQVCEGQPNHSVHSYALLEGAHPAHCQYDQYITEVIPANLS